VRGGDGSGDGERGVMRPRPFLLLSRLRAGADGGGGIMQHVKGV